MPLRLAAGSITAVIMLAALCTGQDPPVYKDPSAPFDRRVDDLIARMTLEEKVAQMMNDAPAIERLGVPAYNWWNECLHGVARAGRATVFPETIGMAATWDDALLLRVAAAISDEARAKHHEFLRRGKHDIYQGLTFWTPNINLFRDPRWGRGMETYGEDPYLTGQMGVAFIKGLQGDDPKYLKTVATAKHYAVHSGPEPERHTFDAVVSENDLLDTYLPHFEAAVRQGDALSVMCAYNRVDGLPACANPRLLEDILRGQWGFSGYVVSDCGAIGDIYLHHKSAPNAVEGVARAVKAGTDLNCGTEYENLIPAAKQGLVTNADLDRALHRLFLARFRLGEFDPPSTVKYAQIPYSVNDSPAHRELAVETARKSIVLLKNENHILPLRKDLKTLAVIGPDADNVNLLLGNYNGDPTAPVTPLAGIRNKLNQSRVLYARGSGVAEGLPTFVPIPASAFVTGSGAGSQSGIKGEYFASANFDGAQHRPREMTYPSSGRKVGAIPKDPKPVFTRIDRQVDFHWWDGAPRAGMDDDNFGVRWTGYLKAPVSGKYQIGAIGMNAFEFYFDGKHLFDFNNIHERVYQYAEIELEAGKLYPVRFDYHEYSNDADIQLVWEPPDGSLREKALEAARQADAVVMVMGLSPRLEGEEMKVPVEEFSGGDRLTLDLPRVQQDLMEAVVGLGKPTVLVLLNGSAVAVNWAHDHVPAIVEAWYPGQAGGTAIADVLFGDYNPGGRLPVTFYKSVEQLPPFTDYAMKGRTYRFFEGQPLYPFGYGLSYTTFSYSNLKLPQQSATGVDVPVSVEVRNTGSRDGEEVVQLYISRQDRAASEPIRSLEAFRRIPLRAGETKSVQFRLSPRQFSYIEKDRRVAGPGTFDISVGGGQPAIDDVRAKRAIYGRVTLTGSAKELQ
jgi:beta-glucosidase